MKKLILPFVVISFLSECKSSHEKDIHGMWRTDSISNFTNGFRFTNNTKDSHWSYFEYKPDGSLFERRKGEFRKSAYKVVAKDSLVYLDSTGKVINGYKILSLDQYKLVLKKSQKPFFSGKNQELYEIRYFSKVTQPKL